MKLAAVPTDSLFVLMLVLMLGCDDSWVSVRVIGGP